MAGGIDGVLLDLEGTLFQAGEAIAGAAETLDLLRHLGLPLRFLTNTTSRSREEIHRQLADLGLPAEEEEIVTAPVAARDILLQRGIRRVYALLEPKVREDLFPLKMDEVDPEAVVLGDLGPQPTTERLDRAFRFLLGSERPFLTLARNRFYRTREGLTLDTGAYAAALEYATGREAELIGKPALPFYSKVLAEMRVDASRVLMVGDDLEADVLGAQACGLKGVLVRTGKFREEDLRTAATKPDHVIDSISDLPWAVLRVGG